MSNARELKSTFSEDVDTKQLGMKLLYINPMTRSDSFLTTPMINNKVDIRRVR